MTIIRLPMSLLAAAFALLVAWPVLAQQPPVSTRLRGTIQSVNGDTMIVKPREGANVMLHMPAKMPVTGITGITLAQIKVGAYIGVTSMPGPDGTEQAREVHVFPEAMRGAGEGSRPWDTGPGSSMTNGGLDKMVAGNDGLVLTLKYKGGERQVVVTPQTDLVTFVAAERRDLKPGAGIIAVTARGADGALEAMRISVGIGGITPPM